MKSKHPEPSRPPPWNLSAPSLIRSPAPAPQTAHLARGTLLLAQAPSWQSSRSDDRSGTATVASHIAPSPLADTRAPQVQTSDLSRASIAAGTWRSDARTATRASITLQMTGTKQWAQKQPLESLTSQEPVLIGTPPHLPASCWRCPCPAQPVQEVH